MLNKIIKNHTVLSQVVLSCLLMLAFTSISASAQESNAKAVVSDFQNVFAFTIDKTGQLGSAIPEEKYDWRPSEGVRSIREVVLHIAGANYFFGSLLGAEIPEGVDPRSMEKSGMSRDQAVAALEESVTYIQDFLNTLNEEDLNTKIDFFGNEVTKREAIIAMGGHASEHLGQLIAYARMNEVTPPWSQSP